MQFRYLLLLFISISYLNPIFCQHVLYAGIQGNVGNSRLEFDGNRQSLSNSNKAFNSQLLSFSAGYKINNRLFISGSYFFYNSNWAYSDNTPISLPNGDYTLISAKSSTQLQGVGASVGTYFPLNENSTINYCLALKASYGLFLETKPDLVFSNLAPTIEITEFNKFTDYYSGGIETGFSFQLSKKLSLNLLLGYSYSFSKIFKTNYTLNLPNQESTEISSTGSAIYMGISINYSLFDFTKLSIKRNKITAVNNDANEVVKLNDRPVKKQHNIDVENSNLSLEVWDYGKIDGDRISLFLNDKIILNDYKLKAKAKIIDLNLKYGKNQLIIYAHNLGKEPPNTVTVVIRDGKKTNKLSLSSNLGKCGSVNIFLK